MTTRQIIDLRSLYHYAKYNKLGVRPPSYRFQNDGHPYTDVLEKLSSTSNITQNPGWYFWIQMEKSSINQQHIYIGKADNLYKRLFVEHLFKGEVFIWSKIYGKPDAIQLFTKVRNYPDKNTKYAEKCLTSHIIWVEIKKELIIDNNPFNDTSLLFVERKFISQYEPLTNKHKFKNYKNIPSKTFDDIKTEFENILNSFSEPDYYKIEDL